MRSEITTPEAVGEEQSAELSLRPQRLEEFIGQPRVKESLRIAVDAALGRKESLDHTLFHGPPGLGKTTLAMLMARELGVNIKTTSGPVLEKPGDLAGILTNLRDGDILFIDEIHRLRPIIEEFLYPAMEDYKIDIRISEGPKAQTITVQVEPFTLIGATTRFGLLTPPMRARFGIIERLNYYSTEELAVIVARSADILGVECTDDGADEIARRSRGTPRVANRLLRRVRDFAEVRADGVIQTQVADDALQMLNVDEYGLDEMDARVLKTIIEKFDGGPRGRGLRHAGGGLRAVPDPERVPHADTARASRHGEGVHALRLRPARRCGRGAGLADAHLRRGVGGREAGAGDRSA